MKIKIDADSCMGHGMCSALAPEVYEINGDTGFNEMGEFEVEEDRHAAAARGASACPERAIRLQDSLTTGGAA
ncbi:ferredoxin [Actinoplanes sp. CA-051413]|uniref:ferredoxin n=1 Tax=Actinoplanes sp. CA-051413 TaxID=3239899 RepID=UPI003D994D1E